MSIEGALTVGPEVCCACARMSEGFKLVLSVLLPCPGMCNSPLALPPPVQGDRGQLGLWPGAPSLTSHVLLLMRVGTWQRAARQSLKYEAAVTVMSRMLELMVEVQLPDGGQGLAL